MAEQFQDAGVAAKPTTTEFLRADSYRPGERIVSKFTRRMGTVREWPQGQARPKGEDLVIGAVWVEWDDGVRGHAWRHQINRR